MLLLLRKTRPEEGLVNGSSCFFLLPSSAPDASLPWPAARRRWPRHRPLRAHLVLEVLEVLRRLPDLLDVLDLPRDLVDVVLWPVVAGAHRVLEQALLNRLAVEDNERVVVAIVAGKESACRPRQ